MYVSNWTFRPAPGKFAEIIETMLANVRQVPGLVNVDTDLRLDNPQLNIIFDRADYQFYVILFDLFDFICT